MYEAEDAEIYDLVHQGRGKDYAAEAEHLREVIRSHKRDASSLLDVACGTGLHLAHLSREFDEVEGLDRSMDMLTRAQRRLPDVRLNLGDMRSFDLGRTFDAVTCLFASVGHLSTVAELADTLRCFARHAAERRGVVVIDPWWFPETFTPHHVAGDVVTADHRTVARVSHSSLEGRASRMDVHYLIADPKNGVRHLTERTLITLFTRDEYEDAFDRAGLTPTYLQGGLSGRGLFVGVRR
ncbi:class I SAM-dependent DNA methyltransferase [Streptomyces sp. NPDC127098]|uniref:class I SAM-dependent DNA methyltransferase n=1 Tax=Streptomyces sp. NPDC127098 TaxID=3347137 RepID=UPI00364F39E2